jgi:hypothetical protein
MLGMLGLLDLTLPDRGDSLLRKIPFINCFKLFTCRFRLIYLGPQTKTKWLEPYHCLCRPAPRLGCEERHQYCNTGREPVNDSSNANLCCTVALRLAQLLSRVQCKKPEEPMDCHLTVIRLGNRIFGDH